MDISEAEVGRIVCFDRHNGEWQIIAIDVEEGLAALQPHPDPSEGADRWEPIADLIYV